jgi:twinkle protein
VTQKEYPEGNDRVISKGPCEKCGSKDNMVLYGDGHSTCFTPGCGNYKASSAEVEHTEKPSHSADLLKPDAGSWPADGLKLRRLSLDTMRKFGVFLPGYNGQRVQAYPYYNPDGSEAGQKLRFPDKTFSFLKAEGATPLLQCQLFGRHVFGDRYDRQVIITEGELDAMSVAQATDFKVAVVSINSGAGSAVKCLKSSYLWLDRFEDIVLWLDNDAPGMEAAEECAKLFKVGKVRIAKHAEFKDASDVLQADRPGDIKTTIYGAAKWRPRGIVNARDNPSDVFAPTEKLASIPYPGMMLRLQEMTGGMFPGEVNYHVAGTGVGKSTGLREIQYHCVEQGHKIAVLSFEDTIKDAKFGLMSIAAGERLQLRELPDPEDTKAMEAYNSYMAKVHEVVFGPGLVELFDPQTAEWTMEAILGYVRYCAKALDCKVIFLDPISFVAAGIDLSADERRMLDFVAKEFAKLAKELDIVIVIAHHLKRTSGVPHEEGAPTSLNELRSSGGLANFATAVIGWERNNQAAGDAWRVTQSRIIKPIRRTGKSGLADVLYYGEDGRLVQSPIPFPPIGKPDGQDTTQGAGGFGPVDY